MWLIAVGLAFAADTKTDKPAEKTDPPPVKMGGVIFAHYGYDLSEGADGYNEFAVDRAYLTAQANLTKKLATRLTLDADRFKSTTLPDDSSVTVDTKYRVFVKHAYLEWKDAAPGVKARFGMVDTPYTPYFDSLWGHRYVMESFAKQSKVLETADLGVSVQGEHAKGLVSWNAALLNGEGYGKLEMNAGKAVQARVTLDPLAPKKGPNLPITAFVSYNGDPDSEATLTYAGALGFKHKYVFAWGEYLGTQKGEAAAGGYSFSVLPRVPDVGGLVLRYDHWDPSTDGSGDSTTTLVGGVDHDFYERVSAAVTYERLMPEEGSASQGVFLRMQAGF